MKIGIGSFLLCMLVITYTVPATGIIIYSDDITENIQDPIQIYRTKVKNLDDGRAAPVPGDLPDDFVFPEIVNDFLETSIPVERTIGFIDDTIIEILLQIDEAMILGYLEDLCAFGPRVTGTTECYEAGDYIYDEFESMGLEVRYDDWSNGGYAGNNIEGTINGINESSDEIYIICAHYDSVTSSPGADDDGSGTAAVLAAANIMSQYQFDHTIRFVAFSGEEQGLLGSHEYVEEVYGNGDNIIAALNADMIAYADTENDGNNIKVYENVASEWITDFSILVSEEYYDYIGLNIIPSGLSYGSDHYSFWQFDYDAVFYHEYHFNPYYHSSQDIIENMNITYSTKSTKLIIATLGELANTYIINNPPETPDAPEGPAEGFEGEELNFSASTTDPEEDLIFLKFDWGDETYSDWFGPLDSGEILEIPNVWEEKGIYEVRVQAKDINNKISDWSDPLEVTINENLAPDRPLIKGPRIGRSGKPLTFTFVSSDSEAHDVFYYIMWGDGSSDKWSGPYASGEEVTFNHTYTEGGRIFINAKAKDQYGQEGKQGQFVLYIIKERTASNQLLIRILERLIERFPNLEFILYKYL